MGACEKHFTWAGSGLTRKYYTRTEERLRGTKHSSLSCRSVSDEGKKFIALTTGLECLKALFLLLMLWKK
jgi:hypothetical protein